ncbi:hypothetical protein MKX01_024472 [Papaver californicum]|nr:hypothetical protein MKX01_024472 [Papaver californicum]
METISLFDMGLESFLRKYEKRYPEVIKYIYKIVLVNKEYFAYVWINEVKHFGIRTSNRVKGTHSVLKRFLRNSQGGCIQLVTIKAKFQLGMTFIKHEHNIDDFKGLHHHVSQDVLNFIISEIRRLEKSKTIVEKYCGCILYKMHDLPCAPMISEYRNQSKTILLSSIDSQWRQINLDPHVSRLDVVFDYLPQLEILRKKWKNSTDPEKIRINEN